MKKLALPVLLTLAVAIPLQATTTNTARGQSYITYDDGGTIIRQAEDGREIEARVNLPLFPGDEVITSRRGRVEIRLSDGNVVALDRSTDVRLRSILDSYDGDAAQTVIELRYGHMVVQRTDIGREYVRLDTDSASYLASNEGVYAVDTDRGRDHVTVFAGNVEVRTPQRTSRVRAGEEAKVDEQGVFDLIGNSYAAADEFERWFLRRSERYDGGSSRYLDRSLAYADYDLSTYGSWVYVSNLGTWCWRPRVAAGWRPYYSGHWVNSPSGFLVWVSYEPWGWVPYHFGRWGYDPMYGWVWLPGTGYSPAWVYWMYGGGYVGWAPAGWWDTYRPYYDWCYRPYMRAGWDNYWNAWGRVRVGEIDLRPWTFMRPGSLIATRVDTGAITTDAVRQRLLRGGVGEMTTVSTVPARFTRQELKDPASAIDNVVRRGMAGGGGANADLTPFIKREPELSSGLRDRIARSRPPAGTTPVVVGSGGASGAGGVAPIGGGLVAPIGGGSVAPIGGSDRVQRGDSANGGWDRSGTTIERPADRGSSDRGGIIRRGDSGSSTDRGSVDRGGSSSDRGGVRRGGESAPPSWRDTIGPRRGSESGETARESAPSRDRVDRSGTPAPRESVTQPPSNDWRSRPSRGETPAPRGDEGRAAEPSVRDIPRRIIEGIGGARVYPSDGGRSRDSSPRDSSPPPRIERSSPPPERSSPPPRIEHSAPPPQHSSPPPSRGDGGASSGEGGGGGRVRRGDN